ncbi:efflux RND transporter periplasmic adaptor subunit [Gallaecimonas xiamenensis]|uniref:RND efflux membrane fusion protein n=1 Tax=Gallaecimonas xiamenensis 3-C-1 TaxID=745411 RepID=K2IUG4_9GAMM|nr:efflux RND transporter periplasmic adaptor subunit [Gallaecimonas xiamenensis]EKE73941.1 RND efflux membrane fusion protein [Gallaecimonas xiamenensis 3-C-1]
MKRTLLLGLAVLAPVALVALIYGAANAGQDSQQGQAWPAVKVALAEVTLAELPRRYQGIGELEATRQVQLTSEVAGRVTRIAFESGQQVQAGQLLVQLNDAVEQAERQRLEAQLRNTQAQLRRSKQLVADKLAPQEQLDNAEAARDMAKGELMRVEALIDQKAIKAPFAGVMGIRRVQLGQYLDTASPIANLVDGHRLKSNFALDERTLPGLALGQPVKVRVDAFPEEAFEAKVVAIDPLVGKSRTLQLQAELSNGDGRLKAGMFASIAVLRQDQPPALLVPQTAVTYSAYGDTVFVAEPGPAGLVVKRVTVQSGERWQGLVEITAGLEQGQQVVTSGQMKLADGMQVEAKADSLAALSLAGEAGL